MRKSSLLLFLSAGLLSASASAQNKSSYTLLLGDYDQSNSIVVNDITQMVTFLTGENTPPLLIADKEGSLVVNGTARSQYLYGDLDFDGDIDEDDVAEVAKILLKKREAPTLVRTFEAKQENYANVNDYGVMKSYINRVAYPNFKIAAAIDVPEFNKKGDLYNLVKDNYDEVVAGNAMKMASIVGNTGYMNFNTVKQFVNTATEAGLNVYGHVLAWHSQQPNAWLGSLIADRKRPVDGETVYLINRDFSSTDHNLGGWGNNSTRTVSNGVLTLSNPSVGEHTYDAAACLDFDEALEKGRTYTLKMKVKSDATGQMLAGLQNPDTYAGCGDFSPITLTSEWKEYTFDCECTGDNAKRFFINFGHIAGDILIDDLQLYTVVAEAQEQPATTSKTIEKVADYDFSSSSHLFNGWGGESSRSIEDGVMVLTNPTATEHDYNVQAAIDFSTPLRNGYTYTVKMKIKSNQEGSIGMAFQHKSDYAARGYFPSVTLSSDWKEIEVSTTVTGDEADRFLISYGNIAGNIYIDDFQLFTYVEGDDVPLTEDPTIDYFISSDFSDASQLIGGWNADATYKVEDGVMKYYNPTAVNFWEVQAATDFDQAFVEGKTYTLSLRVKSDAEGLLRVGFQNPDGYKSCGNFANITLSSAWQTVELSCTVTGSNAKRFIFSFGDVAGTIYIDNLQLYIDPYKLTAAEKKEILTDAMSQWINGMMDATECKVKDWDMINEAVSGGGDVNGYYDLQHFDGYQGGTWDVGGSSFYWQDYFGSEEYGVIVERLARKAYVDHGGKPEDLILFVNDYNLESDWDDNKKLKSLIYWIGIWEKGGAKIDGIGTQMHINYYRNEATQASKEEHITKMFELMAATGKLIRVSELDMGVYDENGNKLTVAEYTDADKVAMAEHYEWIVKQYMTILNKDQQYGICQWSLTDSPEQSGWRANEPIGLYTLDYKRKPSYAGWAEGLRSSWK